MVPIALSFAGLLAVVVAIIAWPGEISRRIDWICAALAAIVCVALLAFAFP